MSGRERLLRVDEDVLAATRSLFPGADVALGRSSTGRASFRLVPGLRRTKMLVPADAPSAAGDAVDRPTAKDTRRQIVRRRAVAALLRTPVLARVAMPDVLQVGPATDTLLDYLEAVVGEEVRVSIAIGARRANRKPVLSVHRRDGREVGYAKVGLSPLANELIDHEATTLASLASGPNLRTFRAPSVLHHGGWKTSRVLIMGSLRPPRARPSRHLPVEAIAELASRDGLHTGPLGDSSWLSAIQVDATRLSAAGRPELLQVWQRFEDTFGDMALPLGGSHGDLGPWNMAWDGQTPQIWDWERAQTRTPIGIDAVHFTCHPVLRDVGNLVRARDVLAGAGSQAVRSVLTEVGADRLGPRADRAILGSYLLSMAARFTVDANRPDGDVVGDLARWYLTVLSDTLDQEEHIPWN